MIAGILLFTFCSAGAAALYAFGRRQSSRDVQFALIPAAVAEPVASTRPYAYEAPSTPDEEAGVPRWLRASVRAERFWTPEPRDSERDFARYSAEAFNEAPTDAPRAVVRDDVTLLDGPNESYAAIVGRLHAGDEVRVVLMDANWAEVRTSNGASGWLPSMALGGLQGEPPVPRLVQAPAPEEAPAAEEVPVPEQAPAPELAAAPEQAAEPEEAPASSAARGPAKRSRSSGTRKRRTTPPS